MCCSCENDCVVLGLSDEGLLPRKRDYPFDCAGCKASCLCLVQYYSRVISRENRIYKFCTTSYLLHDKGLKNNWLESSKSQTKRASDSCLKYHRGVKSGEKGTPWLRAVVLCHHHCCHTGANVHWLKSCPFWDASCLLTDLWPDAYEPEVKECLPEKSSWFSSWMCLQWKLAVPINAKSLGRCKEAWNVWMPN